MGQDFQHSQQSSGWDGQDRRTPPPLPPEPQHRGVKFDATINLGHVLTFVGFVIAGFTAWSTLDKRVTVIEERASLQALVDKTQDSNLASSMSTIKDALGDIKTNISRINERLDRAKQ